MLLVSLFVLAVLASLSPILNSNLVVAELSFESSDTDSHSDSESDDEWQPGKRGSTSSISDDRSSADS